ncbi:GNAT family N-acetyltransferase [Halomonas elongata]|uniref:GNAT family N-acetyltransferase n=1 Tax=Halomonas elongata TaxID=2746 RepID=UPI002E2B511C|nr:GNAT family N-acetyltransferase [Halomonas elongata]WVI70230.1 GNAT family N-acetyltransferase [Halomonas elongata]
MDDMNREEEGSNAKLALLRILRMMSDASGRQPERVHDFMAQRWQHWQGRLLALRHGDGPPLGMVLACRPDDEAAWQLRFFFISQEWKGSGHGARLLTAARPDCSSP